LEPLHGDSSSNSTSQGHEGSILGKEKLTYFTNKAQQSKLEDEKVSHCELNIIFNNLMSNGVCGNKFQSQVALDFVKTLMCSRKVEFLAP